MTTAKMNQVRDCILYKRQMSIIFTIYGYYKIRVVIIGVWLLISL